MTANFLWYPDIRAYADGRPVACKADMWGRIAVPLAELAAELAIRYEPPWRIGITIGAVLVLFGLLIGRISKR